MIKKLALSILAIAVVVVIVACGGTTRTAPPPPPPPTPTPAATPLPERSGPPTPTPPPITELPNRQIHYQTYRIYHFLYEYDLCFQRAYSNLPPGTELSVDSIAITEPTPTPDPNAVEPETPVATPVPIPRGGTDIEIEDYALRDIPASARWLIAQYTSGTCHEPSSATVFPGRLPWLDTWQKR